MQAALEISPGPDKNVCRDARTPEPLVSEPAASLLCRGIVRYDDQQVKVAIRPRFTPRFGPEEINAQGIICVDKPGQNLIQPFVNRTIARCVHKNNPRCVTIILTC